MDIAPRVLSELLLTSREAASLQRWAVDRGTLGDLHWCKAQTDRANLAKAMGSWLLRPPRGLDSHQSDPRSTRGKSRLFA